MKIMKLVCALLLATAIVCTATSNGNTTTSEANIPSETKVKGLTLEETNDINQMKNYLIICEAYMNDAHEMAERARELGYGDDHTIIQIAKAEYNSAFVLQQNYQTKIEIQEEKNRIAEIERKKAEEAERKRLEEIERQKALKQKREQKSRKYPTAAYVWYYLKDLGFNDYVCAGILGNFMAETGGQTLNIIWDIRSNGYYGIAQWSRGHSKVWGKDLHGQCVYLTDTMQYEFNTFGSNYYRGFNYQQFKNLTNEKDAALAFAKCYERCGSGSYSVRQRNATTAYNYFVN